MPFCCCCRDYVDASFAQVRAKNVWCPRCRTVVASSLCKVPCWVLGIIVIATINLSIAAA